MTTYQKQVRAAIAATRFLSASEILWFGKPAVLKLPRRIRHELSPATLVDHARLCLQDRLYCDFYSKGMASPSEVEIDSLPQAVRSSPLAQELSNANGGTGSLDPGWQIRSVDGSTLVVFRQGLEVKVRFEDCQFPAGSVAAAELPVTLRLPKELLTRLPGFYVAMGNERISSDVESRRLIRLYWNVTPESAIELMRGATRLLNDEGLPFELKIANDADRVQRCDSAVLYVHQADFSRARPILQRLHHQVAWGLKPSVPALTKRLARGLGLAEDPGHGSSFGEHRCRLLAAGLMQARDLGKSSLDERFEVVADVFHASGISLDTPYLNDHSDDVYEFESERDLRSNHEQPGSVAAPQSSPKAATRSVDDYLDAAHRIGSHLCQDATWSDGRCNWMGADVDTLGHSRWRTLGPDLYDGTAGVALFLAELFDACGDAKACATALAAIEHAVSTIERDPSAHAPGLFTGRVGIALAAARVGIITVREELLTRAKRLVSGIDADLKRPQHDVISGMAGAILGLLVLRELLHDPSLLRVAERLGDALLDGAHKLKGRWSWPTLNTPGEQNLTGFSHGAAGIGHALFELFEASSDPRYATGATMAFAFERHWFAAADRNWPDLRGLRARTSRADHTLPCCPFWCHGAPGIAVSRIRASEITRDERCRSEALLALETTGAVTETALRNDALNYSLCHGLTGNAEILLLGSRVFGDAVPWAHRIASDVAAAGIERYGADATTWPCGAGGLTPALMLGLAGIGRFYLRLANAGVPSVLMFAPRDFADAVEPEAARALIALAH